MNKKPKRKTVADRPAGGWALLNRVQDMWASWSDETIHLLIEKGIADPDLLVATSQSELPDGSHVGKLCSRSYEEAFKHQDALKAELTALVSDKSARSGILKRIAALGLERERAGHFGAQLELMAADQLANTKSAETTARTKGIEGKRARRMRVFKVLILEKSYQHLSAYALCGGYFDEFEEALQHYNRTVEPAKKLKMVDDETLKRDLREILKEFRPVAGQK